MIPAVDPVQRPRDARLLVVDHEGRVTHAPRSRFLDFVHPSDVVVANDAATLPASLHGVHVPSGSPIEVRLAGRASLAAEDVRRFSTVVFGPGDYRVRTEDRPLPPPLAAGDRLALGPARHGWDRSAGEGGTLNATVERLLGHPRLAAVRFEGPPRSVWAGIAWHGRPIQYAHVTAPLALWDVWSAIAGLPAAFEPPSASFALDWAAISAMRERGIGFATITVAAGISSTGDAGLDRRLPFDEPYAIPEATASAIRRARAIGGRVIAVGTSVVRALEHAATGDGVVAGHGVASQRVGPATALRVVDAILSGTHEPGSSHFDLLRAFAPDATLAAATAALESAGYRTHEFGDSVLIERRDQAALNSAA
jgi:S-adenosylmethionine:tRNA ribosyltransferase-isomerase